MPNNPFLDDLPKHPLNTDELAKQNALEKDCANTKHEWFVSISEHNENYGFMLCQKCGMQFRLELDIHAYSGYNRKRRTV